MQIEAAKIFESIKDSLEVEADKELTGVRRKNNKPLPTLVARKKIKTLDGSAKGLKAEEQKSEGESFPETYEP